MGLSSYESIMQKRASYFRAGSHTLWKSHLAVPLPR